MHSGQEAGPRANGENVLTSALDREGISFLCVWEMGCEEQLKPPTRIMGFWSFLLFSFSATMKSQVSSITFPSPIMYLLTTGTKVKGPSKHEPKLTESQHRDRLLKIHHLFSCKVFLFVQLELARGAGGWHTSGTGQEQISHQA